MDYSKRFKKQAHTLKKAFGIPHSVALDLIAIILYQCKDYKELRAVVLKHPEDSRLSAASISPKSKPEEILAFEKSVPIIANRLSSLIYSPIPKSEYCRIIRQTCGFKDEIPFEYNPESIPQFEDLSWKPMGIGPDSKAILKAYIRINDVVFILIAVRVFDPFKAGWIDEKTVWTLPEGTKEILWYPRNAWEKYTQLEAELRNSLDDDDDGLDESWPDEPALPDFTSEMTNFNKWWKKVNDFHETYDDDAWMTSRIQNDAFQIIGFPAKKWEATDVHFSLTESGVNKQWKSDNIDGSINYNHYVNIEGSLSFIVTVDESMLSNETESLNSEVKFEEEINPIFHHPNAEATKISINGKKRIAFIRPTTHDDREKVYKASQPVGHDDLWAWQLETENLRLSFAFLKKLFNKDILRNESSSQFYIELTSDEIDLIIKNHKEYNKDAEFIKKEGEEEEYKVFINVKGQSEKSGWATSSIIDSVSIKPNEETSILTSCFHLNRRWPYYLNKFTFRKLWNAVRYGIVIMKKNEMDEDNITIPDWATNLPLIKSQDINANK